MQLQHKTFPAYGIKAIDESQGVIEAIVSVFNNVDYAGERVRAGAFAKSLARKLPKGVWAHDWTIPIAKTLEGIELMPGDPRLPVDLRKNGGLYIKGQFNLETQRGREAFSDVKFGSIDEFSFGYTVEDSEFDSKAGVHDLVELTIYEWSPVLVGCNPATEMISAKSVCGASNLPLADRGREWDASAAEKGVRSWAGAEDAPNAKYRKAFMICDGPEAEFTSYKLPFGAVDGGELKAVPRALFSIAGVLQGARGGTRISSEDRAGAKAKIAGYYARMRREFGDDSIVVPWDDEKAGEPVETKSDSMPYMEPSMAMAAMREAHEHLMSAVYDGLDSGLGAHEMEPAFDEHKGACLGVYKALCSKPRMKEAALAALKQFADPPAGKADQQLDTLLADAQRCATRQGEIAALRAQEGRTFGEERRHKLAALAAQLHALAAEPVSKILASETAEALLAHYRDRQRRREPAQAT